MKKVSWPKTLAATRKAAGLSQSQAAEIVKTAVRNYKYWESGESAPIPAAQAGILKAIRNSRRVPVRRKRAKIEREHHLFYDHDKGWIFRCTLGGDSKKQGQRIKRIMRTHNVIRAIERRDNLIREWRTLGFTVELRMKKEEGGYFTMAE
jgi:transcriptional regulator with XRE-family HTH domain